MKRIELYRIDTDKFAALVAATCACAGCPMRDDCTEFENTYDRTEVNADTCFGMWRDYFRKDPYVLESANDVSELLESVVDCEKCPINEECVRDGAFGDSAECEYMFECWLSAEIPPDGATGRKNRHVEEQNNVFHPNHYIILPGVEVKDISDAVLDRCGYDATAGAYLFNILKYILRADRKNGVEDYKKALVYLDWLIQRLEKAEHIEEGERNDRG